MIHPIEQVQLELCHLTNKRKTETLKKRRDERPRQRYFGSSSNS